MKKNKFIYVYLKILACLIFLFYITIFFSSNCYSLVNKNLFSSSFVKKTLNECIFVTKKLDVIPFLNYEVLIILNIKKFYQLKKYDDVISLANIFIYRFPSHKHIDFVYYSKASSFFNKTSCLKKDTRYMKSAIKHLQNFILFYPKSFFIIKAKNKLCYASNAIAARYIQLGRFYLEEKFLISSLLYFNEVKNNYYSSLFVPEAYFAISFIYTFFDIKNLEGYYKGKLFICDSYFYWYKKFFML